MMEPVYGRDLSPQVVIKDGILLDERPLASTPWRSPAGARFAATPTYRRGAPRTTRGPACASHSTP